MTPQSARPSHGSDLALALLLGLAFLGGCLWWSFRELALVLPLHRVTASLSLEQSVGPALGSQIAAFAAILLAVHLALGLLAWALARLTEAAFPGLRLAERGWLIAGWFALLAAAAMAGNAALHPSSLFSDQDSWLRAGWAGWPPAAWLLGAMLLLIALLGLRAWRRRRLSQRSLTLAGGAALLLAGGALALGAGPSSEDAAADAPPHIVILGVDSLRTDLTESQSGEAVTPNLDAFLAGAQRFRDTTSPLPRTYPAWTAILTGRHPVTTNARFNLMPRDLVNEGDTLGDLLRARGYRSIYATDEVRFANFDESFGFDQLITPPVGAADFLLGFVGDQPLVNLIAATPAGGWLFPWNHANRAVAVTYRPRHFTARLARELEIGGPSFLAIHLTLPHWPYAWAGMAVPSTPDGYRRVYRASIAAADTQFQEVLELLDHKGVLDNAIVVVLSDHGEALGGPTDSMLRQTGRPREIWDSLWGHGTSVLSPHQYEVLLALRAYGRARLPGTPAVRDWPVALEDLRPTLEELVTGTAPQDVDGLSLVPFLAGTEDPARLRDRVRYTETGFNTPDLLAGRYEASGIIDEAAVFYELDADSGWMQFRRDRLPLLLARKQRAAISADALLAALPANDGKGWRYLFTARRAPLPRPLEGRPDPAREPEAARLWDALHARFPGELSAAAELR